MSLGIIQREKAAYGRARVDDKGGGKEESGGRERKREIRSHYLSSFLTSLTGAQCHLVLPVGTVRAKF